MTFNKHYRRNIRRGLTIAIEYQDERVLRSFWVRRGMYKFFYMLKEYTDYNLGITKELV